ncbi:hypothetical protein [Neotabrizicola sp. sgz301269]|uniref:hypothetical protein n=1 Tax=Neotabrizicola sp. sgz301269 TaxID=3276282 RepID=UPI0037703D8D
MNITRLLIRAKRWAAHPPSERMVVMVLGIVALALLLAGIEWFWGWPDWLTVNSSPKLRLGN